MARNDLQTRTTLTRNQRTEVFEKTVEKVKRQYFDPKFNGIDWPQMAALARENIVAQEDPEAFETAMHDLVRKLGTSHTGFFHQSARRVPGRLAIGANFRRAETGSGPEWITQDVHTGGPANAVGLRPRDVLLSISGKPVIPPDAPLFPMGAEIPIRIKRGGDELGLVLSIPKPQSRKQPYADIQAVTWKRLPDGFGYLKVAILPGLLGLDVAREIDRAVAELHSCDRLVIDLRGHVGGGLGVLRLMSYLTPDKLSIGYTVTRKLAKRGVDKTALLKLDRLPTNLPNPLAIASMAVRFVGRDPSVLLVSEGLGPKRWHGKISILTNEHTVSAGEMVAAFASENGLAKLVGTETAGRLIPGSGFKIAYGYMLVMPKAEYVTWNGKRFEGSGVRPDVHVVWQPQVQDAEFDNQLAMAINSLDV